MDQNKNWNFKTKQLELLFKEIYHQLKQNPNNYIIIDKWNRRIYNKYRIRLYFALNKEIEQTFKYKIKNNELFKNMKEIDKIWD